MPEGVESESTVPAVAAIESSSAASLASCYNAKTTASSPREKISRACSSVSVGPSGISNAVITVASWPILNHHHIPITHFHKDQLHSAKVLRIL